MLVPVRVIAAYYNMTLYEFLNLIRSVQMRLIREYYRTHS